MFGSRRPALRTAAFAAVALLLLFGNERRGLIGPDEPRYADIAREMAVSGDWLTPRLEGEPWFEKPALLYWLGAAFFKLGAPADLATRLPVALASLAFLLYFHWRMRRFFGEDAADASALLLASSAGWVAFNLSGVFDLLLAASLGAALLALFEWLEEPQRKSGLPWFGAWLGVSVLAKGLVGPALAVGALLPICFRRGPLAVARDLFHPRATGPFLLVAGPWYALLAMREGWVFAEEFLWRHHVLRVYSPELEHLQPWWFYLPVAAAALLPWTPLLGTLRRRDWTGSEQARLLAAWAVSTLLLFSLARNKLPGYLLPALPPAAALLGLRLSRPPAPRAALTAAAALLALFPVVAAVLPRALAEGLGAAWPPEDWPGLSLALFGGGAALAAVRIWRSRRRSLALLAGLTLASLLYLKIVVYPPLDRIAGTRSAWREAADRAAEVCLGDLRRHAVYGLRFYSRRELPPCAEKPRRWRLEGDPPRLVMVPDTKRP